MYTSKLPSCHAGVSSVLDQLADPSARIVSWRKPVYAAIDELRVTAAPAEQIELVERISIALLKLDWALQRNDSEKARQVREQLAALGDSWQGLAGVLPASDDDVVDAQEVGFVTEALERINQRQY